MSLFGLACEGITDQITLENILCGYFDSPDLDEEISYLQPRLDATRQAQQDYGGWLSLLEYLTTERFRDDVLNSGYLIIQVDTDVSDEKHFDVSHYDENNNEVPVETLIENVAARMIEKIEEGNPGFYQQHQAKIIFCISVHSIECWLLSYYTPKLPNNPKTKNCQKALAYNLNQHYNNKPCKLEKTKVAYDKLSTPFLKNKILKKVASKDPSLSVFLDNLSQITID